MFSCPRCSYLRYIQKLSRSYTSSSPVHLGLQSSASRLISQSTWVRLSARRPNLQVYKRNESNLRLSSTRTRRRRFLHTAAISDPRESSTVTATLDDNNPSTSAPESSSSSSLLPNEILPICCPGCGAYAQTTDPNEPGYYSKARKRTRKLLNKAKEALLSEQKRDWEDDGGRDTKPKESGPPKPAGMIMNCSIVNFVPLIQVSYDR